VPSQNRVRRDDRGDLAQDAPSEPVAQGGEPPPIVIHQLEPLPTQWRRRIRFSSTRYAKERRSWRSNQPVRTASTIWRADASITAGVYITGEKGADLTPSAELWDITPW
jgi:hypothetical protein